MPYPPEPTLKQLLHVIREMCADDIDVFLEQLREDPTGEDSDPILKQACLDQLEHLEKKDRENRG